jgi:hypothetical protein
MVPKSLKEVVGTTGIEPVTPTMSTQGVDGKYIENRGRINGIVALCSRSDHVNLGRFLGDDPPPDPQMRSPAFWQEGRAKSQNSIEQRQNNTTHRHRTQARAAR